MYLYLKLQFEDNVTLAGDILAKLQVATTGTDADWVVKVIDVFPGDEKKRNGTLFKMSNYHMMVRSEVMRGRFRNSFITPQAFYLMRDGGKYQITRCNAYPSKKQQFRSKFKVLGFFD
jgi:predicted acyl esterase